MLDEGTQKIVETRTSVLYVYTRHFEDLDLNVSVGSGKSNLARTAPLVDSLLVFTATGAWGRTYVAFLYEWPGAGN